MKRTLGLFVLSVLLSLSACSHQREMNPLTQALSDSIGKSVNDGMELNRLCAQFETAEGRRPESSAELLAWMDAHGVKSSCDRAFIEKSVIKSSKGRNAAGNLIDFSNGVPIKTEGGGK